MEIGSLVSLSVHLHHGERVTQKMCCQILDAAYNILKNVALVFAQISPSLKIKVINKRGQYKQFSVLLAATSSPGGVFQQTTLSLCPSVYKLSSKNDSYSHIYLIFLYFNAGLVI